jgi:tetratricopeptide (TPR) repeat protein
MRAAVAVLVAVAAIGTTGTAVAQSADALVREGVAAFDRGDVEAAITSYRKALEVEPGHLDAKIELAMAYAATGQYGSCSELVDPLVDTSPPPYGPHVATVAATCAEGGSDVKRALRIYRRALKRYPDAEILWFNQGVSLVAAGKLDDAMESADKAARLGPGRASAWLLVSDLHANAGHQVLALLARLRFLAAEPGSPRAAGVAQKVVEALEGGATSEDGKNVTVTIDPAASEQPLGDVAMMLAILSPQRFLEKNAGTPKEVLRAEAIDTLLAYLEEREPGKKEKGAVAEVALPFLVGLHREGLGRTFGREALSSLEDEGGQPWRADHAEEVNRLRSWVAAHGGPPAKPVILRPGG